MTMYMLQREAIGRTARIYYGDHAYHGFVSHRAVQACDAIDVTCECGAVLRIDVSAVLFEQELANAR